MNYALLERPLFYVAGHYVSFLGLIAFGGLFTLGYRQIFWVVLRLVQRSNGR